MNQIENTRGAYGETTAKKKNEKYSSLLTIVSIINLVVFYVCLASFIFMQALLHLKIIPNTIGLGFFVVVFMLFPALLCAPVSLLLSCIPFIPWKIRIWLFVEFVIVAVFYFTVQLMS